MIHEKLSISSDIDLLSAVAERIASHIFTTGMFHESKFYGLNLAIFECLANALEHGNLEVTYDEKSADIRLGTYLENLRKKAAIEPYKNRVIEIEYRVDDSGAVIEIADEGRGFDTESLIEKIRKKETEDFHGRGILLAINMVDSMEYNDTGNHVKIRLLRSL